MVSYNDIVKNATKKVKVFGDWDKSSVEMVNLLQSRTLDMYFHVYKNIQFTDSNYDYAVVFNYPIQPILCPPEKTVGLILEPPEILDSLYPNRQRDKVDGVGTMYAFCHGTEFPAMPGLGFCTAKPNLDTTWPPFTKNHVMMIVSNKVITPWHQKRQAVFDALLATDLPIDFYGRGMSNPDLRCKGEIPSYGKNVILKDYSMCIDFENSPHGAITDKFFDPVLCNTFPVSNAKELNLVAPANSFYLTDWDLSVSQIVEQIKEIISVSDDELVERSYALDEAKKSILSGRMNLTHWIWERINECE